MEITAVWEHNDLSKCALKTGQDGIMTGKGGAGQGQRCATLVCLAYTAQSLIA